MYNEYLAKRTWVLGDTFSIGDIAAVCALAVAERMRPFSAHPNLVAYFSRLKERPSVKKVFARVAEELARR
jgi:glutathione S-transferase